MLKLGVAVFLLGIVHVCSAFNVDNVHNLYVDGNNRELDQTQNQLKNDNDDFFEELDDDESSEIEAVQKHVKYQDGARSALLNFAKKLRKGKKVTNTFLKVIDTFEKEIAEFYATVRRRNIKTSVLSDIKTFIKEASKDRTSNTKILRGLTSQGLFIAQKLKEFSSLGKRDFLSSGAAEFLNNIKDEIGEEAFDEYLSVNGLVTLMFAIDDTGSMGDEIGAAIAISEQIVNAKRDYDVDYILSPFNDPETGPVTRKNETEGADFVKALRALRAYGGGDCPEMAFTGMLNALEAGPQPGSSMFVFTDASPKDYDEDRESAVLDIALDMDIKINFFTNRGGCTSNGFQPFDDVARETGGLVYQTHSTLDLKKLGELVSISTRKTADLPSGGKSSTGRRKRAAMKQYSITVDDTIEQISITVKTQNSRSGVKLLDPIGKAVVLGRVDLTNGVVFNINSPVTGVYTLVVPAGAGEHTYKVSGVSRINIDFGHFYVTVERRGSRIPVPLEQPLEGLPAKSFITIAGAELVKPGSMRVKVVSNAGTVHADKPLTAVGTSGVRYFVRFNPPSGPFKLQLHGQTRKGSLFLRESSKQDQTVPVLLKLIYRKDSNILRRGQNNTIVVKIIRGATGSYWQTYTLGFESKRAYSATYRSPVIVWRGRGGFVRVKVYVPGDAPTGKTENIKLSLTRYKEKNPVASVPFSFLLV